MEKRVRIFRSALAADEADAIEGARMPPMDRIRVVIEFRNRLHPGAAQQKIARVCRITRLERTH